MIQKKSLVSNTCLLLALFVAPGLTHAQPAAAPTDPNAMQVLIKRDAAYLISPENFRSPLSLSATRVIEIRSRVEGVVQNVRARPGATVSLQEELIRIESAQANKVLDRAKANLKAATVRRDLTKKDAGSNPLAFDLAEAELDVAEADLELAQLQYDQASVRAPFAGQITDLKVSPGVFVTEGDVLLELRNSNELSIQLPVDRNQVKAGETLTVQLDNGTVQGKVQAILPLNEKWEALRQLIETAVIAVVVIDNQKGEYQDGQTAYSPIVPRLPVVELANTSLKNSETGRRLVQVLRNGMIRDLEVNLLGPVGEGRSYVSGPFQEGDELILETSQPLTDGTIVKSANPAAAAPANAAANPNVRANPTGNAPGF